MRFSKHCKKNIFLSIYKNIKGGNDYYHPIEGASQIQTLRQAVAFSRQFFRIFFSTFDWRFMSIFSQISDTWQSLVELIIRPPRHEVEDSSFLPLSLLNDSPFAYLLDFFAVQCPKRARRTTV
jgi:hypothetical protein